MNWFWLPTNLYIFAHDSNNGPISNSQSDSSAEYCPVPGRRAVCWALSLSLLTSSLDPRFSPNRPKQNDTPRRRPLPLQYISAASFVKLWRLKKNSSDESYLRRTQHQPSIFYYFLYFQAQPLKDFQTLLTLQQYQVFIVCFTVSNERHLHHKGLDGVYEGVVKLKMFMRTRFYLNFWKNVSTLFLFPKVAMRIQIKLTKCEEIGIFCRNIAEKFIFKFAKLFYIKKHEDLCHFPAQFVISITKKIRFWISWLVAVWHVTPRARPPLQKLISLEN